jgi:hypothetical protein
MLHIGGPIPMRVGVLDRGLLCVLGVLPTKTRPGETPLSGPAVLYHNSPGVRSFGTLIFERVLEHDGGQ